MLSAHGLVLLARDDDGAVVSDVVVTRLPRGMRPAALDEPLTGRWWDGNPPRAVDLVLRLDAALGLAPLRGALREMKAATRTSRAAPRMNRTGTGKLHRAIWKALSPKKPAPAPTRATRTIRRAWPG